jgi:hypothetical protein
VKFKLDENLDWRLAVEVAAGQNDADTVKDEGLSGQGDEAIYRLHCRKAGADHAGSGFRQSHAFSSRTDRRDCRAPSTPPGSSPDPIDTIRSTFDLDV